MQFQPLLFTSTLLLSFGTFSINADIRCGKAKLTYDQPRDQVIVQGLTDFDHHIPFIFPLPSQNLDLVADDLCRLFATCMGFNAAQRATQVPACEQTNQAVVERAMKNDLEYPAVIKQLEASTNKIITSQQESN